MTDQPLPGLEGLATEIALPPEPEPEETVSAARRRLLSERAQPGGIVCPCCAQRAAERPRTIHASMAEGLLRFHCAFGRRWGKAIERLSTRQNCDFAKLRYWGLIEGGRELGVWRVTGKGVEFLGGRQLVPRSVRVFNGAFCGYVDELDLIAIGDVLPFNADDIDAGVPRSSS
jgi:hypothetical protein